MSIKTKIKNDLWRFNYILPFAKKHQFDEKGKADFVKQILRTYKDVGVVKSKERTVGSDILALMKAVDITIDLDSAFLYSLDIHKTFAVPGNIVSNFTLDYDRIIHGSFDALCEKAMFIDDEYGREAKLIKEAVHTMCDRMMERGMNNRSSGLRPCFLPQLSISMKLCNAFCSSIRFCGRRDTGLMDSVDLI